MLLIFAFAIRIIRTLPTDESFQFQVETPIAVLSVIQLWNLFSEWKFHRKIGHKDQFCFWGWARFVMSWNFSRASTVSSANSKRMPFQPTSARNRDEPLINMQMVNNNKSFVVIVRDVDTQSSWKVLLLPPSFRYWSRYDLDEISALYSAVAATHTQSIGCGKLTFRLWEIALVNRFNQLRDVSIDIRHYLLHGFHDFRSSFKLWLIRFDGNSRAIREDFRMVITRDKNARRLACDESRLPCVLPYHAIMSNLKRFHKLKRCFVHAHPTPIPTPWLWLTRSKVSCS